MRLSKIILIGGVITLSTTLATAQMKHEHPDHPKGLNSADQYEALPFYNEACELYAKGRVKRAKRSLYEAINTSFALTEAQLFLGDIFYEEKQLDSAFIYLNSGIDFATKQEPQYYFKMFEIGMILEQYDVVKHNLKHFTKLYGYKSGNQYQKEHPYTLKDYEKVLESIELVHNYKNWIPTALIKDTFTLENGSQVDAIAGRFIYLNESELFQVNYQKGWEKSKKMKISFPESNSNIVDFRFSSQGNYLWVSTKNTDSTTTIYIARKDDEFAKWKEWNSETNSVCWNGLPFYDETNGRILYATNKDGSKDIFSGTYDSNSNQLSHLLKLEINTDKGDEVNPVIHDGVFYFSSNGLPGFGGYDLFHSSRFSITNDRFQISSCENLNKPYNTGNDELKISFYSDKHQLLERVYWNKSTIYLMINPLPQTIQTDLEIKTVVLDDIE